MKACKVAGCPKPAGVPGTAWGWCSTHYTRWQKTGDPLVTPVDLKPVADPLCSVLGCGSPRWALGFCGTHYRRFKTHGEAGAAERLTKPATGRCSVTGCHKRVRSKDLCNAHFQRQWRYGDPLSGGARFGLHDVCMVLNCARPHYARGLCRQHWATISSARNMRRADRLGVTILGNCTPEQLISRLSVFGNRCWMCHAPADQVDHVKPLSAGGSAWPSNLRPACRDCNQRKSSTWPLTNVKELANV